MNGSLIASIGCWRAIAELGKVSGVSASFLHLAQLPRKNPSGICSGTSSSEREYRGKPKYYYRYLFALGAVTLIGVAIASIGVYCICYCGDKHLAVGVAFLIVGGATFVVGVPCVLGMITIYAGYD